MAANRSLDVPEQQIAVDFFDDDEFAWHMRLLLITGGNGKWIWATPDLEVQYGDLSNHRVVPLSRASPYPNRIQGSLYAFDPISASELDTLRTDAVALAGVLGLAVPAGAPGAAAPRWVVADPADDRFGEQIDAGIAANPDKLVKKEATGVAHLPDARGGHRWVAVENVADGDHQK